MSLSAVSTTKQATYTESEKKKFIKHLKEWAENDYLLRSPGPLTVPSVAEMHKYSVGKGMNLNKLELTKIRNELEIVSRYKKLGNKFKKKKALWMPSFVPASGWVHIDIGFIGESRKQYGEFIIAVDTLTRRVRIKTFTKKAKTRINIQQFIIDLMNDPVWSRTYRIVTDGETGVSDNAIEYLQSRFPELRIIKLEYNLSTKAFLSERMIRTFKSKLSRYCLAQKIHLSKWRQKVGGRIPANVVVQAMNDTKIVGSFTPNRITPQNEQEFIQELIKTKKKYAFTFLYGLIFPQETATLNKLFKFKEGDKVLIALKEHPNSNIRNKQKYKKPTISGHFNKDSGIFVIVWRTFTVSSKFYLTFYYRLKYNNGIELPRLYHEDLLRPYST